MIVYFRQPYRAVNEETPATPVKKEENRLRVSQTRIVADIYRVSDTPGEGGRRFTVGIGDQTGSGLRRRFVFGFRNFNSLFSFSFTIRFRLPGFHRFGFIGFNGHFCGG